MSFFTENPFHASLACDYYKIGHPFMQPEGMEQVYSTWTARSAKHHPGCPQTVVFGHQYVIRHGIHEFFQKNFFDVPVDELEAEYNRVITGSFNSRYASFKHLAELHALGHLPLEFWGVPEGTLLPVGVPELVFFNTDKRFAWLPQFIEDIWSANAWLPATSATTAHYRKKLLAPFVEATSDNPAQLEHMCGDFSLRGHTSLEAGYLSSAGHCLSFDRTATIHANTLISRYYMEDEPAGLGMPSLEHSVVEQGIAYYEKLLKDKKPLPEIMERHVRKTDETWDMKLVAEMCFILHLLADIQPTGIITYVSDTYDYWGVLTKILPVIRDVILERRGCFCVRPDSGDPVEIVCGKAAGNEAERKGSMEILFDIFGERVNEKGYKVLPPQVRLIYGDAITAHNSVDICTRLMAKGISSACVIFGIGAYTYQFVTRDTRGYAVKATWGRHKDLGPMQLYKEPKTAPWKKSVRGCVAVLEPKPGKFEVVDGLNLEDSLTYPGNIFVRKYRDGRFSNEETFGRIRNRFAGYAALEKEENHGA